MTWSSMSVTIPNTLVEADLETPRHPSVDYACQIDSPRSGEKWFKAFGRGDHGGDRVLSRLLGDPGRMQAVCTSVCTKTNQDLLCLVVTVGG